MEFFDTHIHLDATEFDSDRDIVWQRAKKAGVVKAINVGVFPDRWKKISGLADEYAGIMPGIGIHPMVTNAVDETSLEQMQKLLKSGRFKMIGEIGLDSLYDDCPLAVQEKFFRSQLTMSLQFNLPIALHIRKQHQQVLRILDDFGRKEWAGIAHCFSGSLEQAQEFIKRGFLISLAGPLTNPDARRLQRVARELPIQRLVVETDSPDLPPRYLKTRRNEPAFVIEVVKALAEIRNEAIAKVAEKIFQNACNLFELDE
ncbi:TatD family hydrolase [candidate division KSB1 bacterium]|nr:TatD family hydrolase [candidate division KSB1 bacterium]